MNANASTRRSERLRRKKRASTPGLSQPGAYSLYGTGYVVESEASFLPPSTPPPSSSAPVPASGKPPARRLRYQHSPHRVSDDSPVQPAAATPRSALRAAEHARLSLFDILGSAARRPVAPGLRARHPAPDSLAAAAHPDPDSLVPATPDDVAPAPPAPRPRRPRRLLRPAPRSPRLAAVVIPAIVALLVLAALIVALESVVHARALPYWARSSRPPLWRALVPHSVSLPHLPALPSLPLPSRTRGLAALRAVPPAAAAALRYLFRGAWSPRYTSPDPQLTAAQLEAAVLPRLLSEARRTAAEEAARVTRELRPPDRSSGASGRDFDLFTERYAADKGLPPDYALLSVGASVRASHPSVTWLYARFVRDYVEALVTEGAYTPLLPRRPQAALTPDVFPGNCWAFPGETGSITIRLARPVRPTSVTMEHTPKRSVFSTLSAPRRFRVLGVPLNASKAVVSQGDMVMLGEFVFDLSDDTRHLQTFVLGQGEHVEQMRAVKVDILSNHGASHTALYRIRVHGIEVGDEGH